MNQVMIIGNSGSDPELRYTANQIPMIAFNVATSKKVKEAYQTTWHRVVLYGEKALEFSTRIKKGSRVFVQGEIENRAWQDKEGITQRISEILARQIQIIEKAPQNFVSPAAQTQMKSSSFVEEDIPF